MTLFLKLLKLLGLHIYDGRFFVCWDSVVGTATHYRLDGLGIESQWWG